MVVKNVNIANQRCFRFHVDAPSAALNCVEMTVSMTSTTRSATKAERVPVISKAVILNAIKKVRKTT